MERFKLSLVPVEEIPQPGDVAELPDLIGLYCLFQYMEFISNGNCGIGLSAFQVGKPYKAFIIKEGKNYRHFANCEYEPIGTDKIKSMEGCLSLHDSNGSKRYFILDRWLKVKVVGKELVKNDEGLSLVDFNEIMETTTKDHKGIVFQHEIDHQNGILISDIGSEIDVNPRPAS